MQFYHKIFFCSTAIYHIDLKKLYKTDVNFKVDRFLLH